MDVQVEVELTALVRQRECLWLFSHPNYHRLDVGERLLLEIVTLLAGVLG